MSDESGIKNIARGARDAARTRASLVRRIEALEAEVQEQRQLNRRVAELTDPPQKVVMDAQAWNDSLGAYYDEHDSIATDQEARSPSLLQVEKLPETWRLRQVVVDPDGDLDWGITAEIDLPASDEAGAAVLTVNGFGRLGG